MHKVAGAITAAVDVPFVHIADTTAEAVRAAGLATVGLLATGYTMEQDFYVGRLRDRHGLDVLVPEAADRRSCTASSTRSCAWESSTTARVRSTGGSCRGLAERGAQGILLGCTEIDLLIGQADSPVPVFDTTRLHAERAVDLALAGSEHVVSSGPPDPRTPAG